MCRFRRKRGMLSSVSVDISHLQVSNVGLIDDLMKFLSIICSESTVVLTNHPNSRNLQTRRKKQ